MYGIKNTENSDAIICVQHVATMDMEVVKEVVSMGFILNLDRLTQIERMIIHRKNLQRRYRKGTHLRDHAARYNYETEYGVPTGSGFEKRTPKIPLDHPLRLRARAFMAGFEQTVNPVDSAKQIIREHVRMNQ